ncbi:DUF2637 domain-containing protein [Kitasatospora sp. A2-31]|uniref:DUF2637 domain-containing protein n=1 Tax=Kitasatospora sp. A2-31 TaxID=2916414 RepID=UPI001EECA357|nr:DUF2637 domain-containing protein [Kitasatospora sp. A2-31]MCG6496641.1 DUF2637 domain-containing protein [Kitasatospora sp. A2-31]
MKVLLGVAGVVGGLVVGAAGFYLSFGNLSTAGHTVFGFSEDDGKIFAVGVDVAILTCLVLDLFMACLRASWPFLRPLAHGLTAASIYFNAAAQGSILENPDKAAAHGLMPALFVIIVEAGRRTLVHQAALPADHDVVPGRRWLFAPVRTGRIFRMMKLWDVGYSVALRIERDRAIFNAWTEYKQDVQKAGLAEGSPEALALLPSKLEPFGLSVDEALALPDEMARQELQRQHAADERARELELATARANHERDKAELAHQREMAELRADLTAVQGVAGAKARGAVAEAEALADAQAKAAAALTDAVESQEAAEVRERAAEADRRAAEARAAAAEADTRTAAEEAKAAADRKRAKEDAQRADEADRRAAEDREQAAEADRRAAEARAAAAEILRRAIDAEDHANLTPRQRRVRTVARLLLAANGAEVTNGEIAAAIGVSESTASEHRTDAMKLIEAGYDPATGYDPETANA